MDSWRYWDTDKKGISRHVKGDGEGGLVVKFSQDITPFLDRNKAMANHNDGYSETRELRRVASIPEIVRMKWMNEEGWDCCAPGNEDRLVKKLNDPDWRYLRTAEGRVGYSNGIMR